MYVDNLVRSFYDVIIKEKVLVLVNYDTDAICAAKILQTLFRYDTIVYTLVPVLTVSDLVSAFKNHKQDVKYVILINCGGTIDIIDLLEPSEDIIFFVADNHRPTDICNVYSSSQIRILTKPERDEGVPDFEEIFRDESEHEDDSAEDEDQNETEESRQSKRRRIDEEAIIKRREVRLWHENRNKIMFEYTQFSYFSRSTAILMFELSWQLHRDNVDLLWCGIIGVTDLFILGKVEILQYLNEVERISAHAGRLCPAVSNADSVSSQSTQSVSGFNTSLRVECEKDLQLALYRHWTVESSLRYTMFTAIALKLWAIRGEKRLYQLLAEMGLPLAQSRQQYNAMDLTLKKEFHTMMEKVSNNRNLGHMTYPSFTLVHGFRTKYQASDYVYAMLALLSNMGPEKHMSDCFFQAMDSLSRSNKIILDDGIDIAKKFLMCMFRHVQNALDMKQILSAGPFYYVILQEGTLHIKYYSNPDCFLLFATFALRAYVAASRKSKCATLPLVASAPLDENFCLVVGVPPIAETSPKSFFGKAFEQAVEKTKCFAELDYFNSTVMKMNIADRPKFFDALTALLS